MHRPAVEEEAIGFGTQSTEAAEAGCKFVDIVKSRESQAHLSSQNLEFPWGSMITVKSCSGTRKPKCSRTGLGRSNKRALR